MKKITLAIAALFTLSTIFSFTVAPLKLGAAHKISFSTFGVSGEFKKFGGTISFDEANLPASNFDVVIDINSIKTSFALQDKHAKGADWFDAAAAPYIRFTSKRIEKAGANYQAIGDLRMHGITKEITLPFSYKKNATGGTFTGSFVINRVDFKVGEPGGMVGEEIKVKVAVPVTK
jgi:polyisoprenoid-binding protein YceI